MKLLIQSNGHDAHAGILLKKIKERIPVEAVEGGTVVVLEIDSTIAPAESYEIVKSNDAWHVIGSCTLGLYYGIGKFLHSAKWSEHAFPPVPTNGTVTPACDFRAMYFAVHFYNRYHIAPIEELENYLIDLLLWGYNTIISILPVVNITHWRDPLHADAEARLRMIFRLTKQYGMRVGLILNPNQVNRGAPEELGTRKISEAR